MKKKQEEDIWPRCIKCDKKVSSLPHKCPLDGVLGPESETGELCNCCETCEGNCALEV